ncbi:MAG: nitrilase-related carbon-nitrogen hydrolase [Mucilaginibacter sp.]
MTADNNKTSISIIWVLTGIVLSGLLWYISIGLNGDFWYLMWVAPVPILLLSLKTSGRAAFVIAFIAYIIGRLSWVSYLVTVATLVPAIIFTILPSLVFALIIIGNRWCIKRLNAWYTVFVFPVLFTTFEYGLIKFSADGTAASIAYTQLNCVPFIQVAAIAGILGITFMLTFIPSAIALAWHYRAEKLKLRYISITGVMLVIVVLGYGVFRMNNFFPKSHIRAGLAVLDEKAHTNADQPNFEKEKLVAIAYAAMVKPLAAQGAQVVLFPERVVGMGRPWADSITRILSDAAKQNHVFIITGYTNQKGEKERNSGLVIDVDGKVVLDYNKAHLVVGLERQFTPGTTPGIFKLNGLQSGLAVCKDLDFQDYIKQYSDDKPGVLYVPAWDFVVDDWLHCRMAILRSVENGFSMVRAARRGRLTINDQFGRVTNEASCANDKQATLVGDVSPQHIDTVYAQYGNWLGGVCLLATVGFIVLASFHRHRV